MKHLLFVIFLLLLFSCNSETEPGNNDSVSDSVITLPAKIKTDTFYESENSDPENKKGYKLMSIETVGKLKLGFDSKNIIAEMGNPDKKTAATEWGADGLYHQDWTYDAAGIEVNMSGNDSLKMEIFSLRFFTPCTLKTSRNIGIGSSIDDVKAAYREEISGNNDNEQSLVAGSIYGGIIFNFENGKLSSAFIGSAAE